MTFLNLKTYYIVLKMGLTGESCMGEKFNYVESPYKFVSFILEPLDRRFIIRRHNIITYYIYIYLECSVYNIYILYIRSSNYFSALFFANKIEYYPEQT